MLYISYGSNMNIEMFQTDKQVYMRVLSASLSYPYRYKYTGYNYQTK